MENTVTAPCRNRTRAASLALGTMLGTMLLMPMVAEAELCRDAQRRIVRCPDSDDPEPRCADARGFAVRCGLPGAVLRGGSAARELAARTSEANRYGAVAPVDPTETGRVRQSRAFAGNGSYAAQPRPLTPRESRIAGLRRNRPVEQRDKTSTPDPYGTQARAAARNPIAPDPYGPSRRAPSPYAKP